MRLIYILVLLVLGTATNSNASIRQRKDKAPDTMRVTVSKFTILPLLQGGLLVGGAVESINSSERALYGYGGRIEYSYKPKLRFDVGLDLMYGTYDKDLVQDVGHARFLSIGTVFMHKPEKRSSLFIRGEIGKVFLITDRAEDNTKRNATQFRIGIGQSHFVSKTRSTRIELYYRIINVTTGDSYPYVGVFKDNITYFGFVFSFGFGVM